MKFTSARKLAGLIDAYFEHISGSWHIEEIASPKKTDPVLQKIWDREPEPATIAGLALYLGFNSRKAFDAYTASGEHSAVLARALLRIEAEYEKKLYQQASGATFALKNFGWHEKDNADKQTDAPLNLKIEILESGPEPASKETDIIL